MTEKLHEHVNDDAPTYDVVVIGGAAAGLSGSKVLARSRRSVLVVDAGEPRNAPADGVHNYLYREGASPAELRAIGRAEAAAYGVELVEGRVTGAAPIADAAPGGARFTVTIDTQRSVHARRLLITAGAVDELPDIPGVREGWGEHVLHCPFCHGWEARGRAIGVLGTGPMAVHQALLFGALTDDLVLFQHTSPDPSPEDAEKLSALGIRVVTGEVAALEYDGADLTGVRLADGRTLAREVVALSSVVRYDEAPTAGLGLTVSRMEMDGHLLATHLAVTAPTGATDVPGVWAAGNAASPMAQVSTSAADAVMAGAAVHMDLIAEDAEIAVERQRRHSGRHSAHGHPPAATDPHEFWEEFYREGDPWSGRPNPLLVDVVDSLPAGRALDLGCGGGGDALWLAARGWQVSAVDISPTATARLEKRVAEAGLGDRVRAEVHDLSASLPEGGFDLVNAQYLQSPVDLPRPEILRRAAATVRPGGLLLVVDHASAPSWSWAHQDHEFATVEATLEEVGLDLRDWDVVRLGAPERESTGPQGQRGTVRDNVIALRRR